MPTYTYTLDPTIPAGTEAKSLGDDRIRELKNAIIERLAEDHYFYAAESGHDDIGYHRKLTLFKQTSDPTAVTDTGIVYTKDVSGVPELYFMNESGTVYQLTNGGYLYGNNIRIDNNTYLKAKNAAGSGTVDLIKANASDKPVIPDGSQLATSAAPTADADISNKKYVDDKVAAVPAQVGLGSWATKSNNTVYQATTDGFVCAVGSCQQGDLVVGYTDNGIAPATVVVQSGGFGTNANNVGITFPVKKNDYWKVTGATTVYWLPLGS